MIRERIYLCSKKGLLLKGNRFDAVPSESLGKTAALCQAVGERWKEWGLGVSSEHSLKPIVSKPGVT